jgi:hypothetical protein
VAKKTNSAKQLSKIIRADISNAFKNQSMWSTIGKDSVNLIRGQMIGGKGVDKEAGNPRKFKDVSDSYAKYRKPTSPLAPKRGKKSRLINSGKMIDDMAYTNKINGVNLGFKTKRSAEIAEYHDKLGAGRSKILRPFFNLSKNQLTLLKRIMKKFVNKTLEK